jgi:hypothetical protein
MKEYEAIMKTVWALVKSKHAEAASLIATGAYMEITGND